eukprot:5168-Heterococcus_DN1.PRE.9
MPLAALQDQGLTTPAQTQLLLCTVYQHISSAWCGSSSAPASEISVVTNELVQHASELQLQLLLQLSIQVPVHKPAFSVQDTSAKQRTANSAKHSVHKIAAYSHLLACSASQCYAMSTHGTTLMQRNWETAYSSASCCCTAYWSSVA